MMSGPEGGATRDGGPDGCPGAVRVHQAADGGLARVRLPGGRLRAGQLAVLCAAAADLGDPRLELTSRGNVQIRALAPGAERELATRLHAAGLLPSEAHERVRNVVASPMSGRDGAGLLDVRPLVEQLDALIVASGVLAELPGRFLVTLDDGRGDVSGITADVGLHATAPDRLALLLAGVDTGLRVPPPAAAALVVAAATAFLAERAAVASPAWRLSELPDGVARITASLIAAAAGAPAGARVDLPFAGAGRLTVPPPKRPPVGVLSQSDGRLALSLVVPLGRLTPAACGALCAAADEIIVTPWRTVIAPDLDASPAGMPDLVADPASAWVGVTACAGRPHCAKAHADVRHEAHLAVVPATRADGAPESARADGAPESARADGAPESARADGAPEPLPVHFAGCERRCGRPTGRHVEVLALADGAFEVGVDGERERIRRPGDLAVAVTGWRTQ